MKGPQAEEVEEWRRQSIERDVWKGLGGGREEIWFRTLTGVSGTWEEDGEE